MTIERKRLGKIPRRLFQAFNRNFDHPHAVASHLSYFGSDASPIEIPNTFRTR